jgi:ubiquinone/menaquinone biosynthesis C-methylase UbiE
MADDRDEVLGIYAGFDEWGRLDTPIGRVEWERTIEVLERYLPPPPAVVADVAGGPGRHALWLAERGYRVIHRDLVPAHVERVTTEAGTRGLDVDADVGDAREVHLGDSSVDAMLFLGPLYHLTVREDRFRALGEARRVLRPGGVLFAGAISRWAARLHGMVANKLYREYDTMTGVVEAVEASGRLPPLEPGDFAGYTHRPDELREELSEAGFEVLELISVEGIALALQDLAERLDDPLDHVVVLDAARATAEVPELLGLGPHLLAVARRPA